MDTIFALASAGGKAGVAVVRLSGPAAHQAVAALAPRLPPIRHAALRRLVWQGEALDEALVLLFAEGASFTGEAMAELHVHGAPPVIRAVLSALGQQEGLRLAEPGEFTRRALENGRLDLAQVEGLADLIDAETEAQRRQALRVLSGAIGRRAEDWRALVVRAAALIEASIDFADEDVPVDVRPEVTEAVSSLLRSLRAEVSAGRAAERVRAGFEVAIIGPPNAGKSSLLNALAGREAAITSDVAGTTRDVIEVRMEIGGLAVSLLDTAGLRETEDRVEKIGIERAIERANGADLRVALNSPGSVELRPGDILVTSKADLAPGPGLNLSVRTGQGIDALLARISAELSARAPVDAVVTRERHRLALERAIRALESAQDQLGTADCTLELVAADLRVATRALEALVGRVDVETLLDEIFASFCIGK